MKSVLKNHKLVAILFVLALILGGIAIPLTAFGASGNRYNSGPVNVTSIDTITQSFDSYGGGSGSSGYYNNYGNRNVATGLSVSCAPTLLTGAAGQTITWFSSVVGGAGNYFYTWNGTDGLSGNTSSLSATYATKGDKFSTLTVISGSQIMTVSCGSTHIGPSIESIRFGSFGASCYATPERVAPGESVTWLAIVSGTTASTTYTWDGSDGLTGNRPLISKIYTTNGIKPAILTVTNGNAQIVAACVNAVTVGAKTPSVATVTKTTSSTQNLGLQGICVPSSSDANTKEEIVWQVAVVGGNGSYQFLWNGDEGLGGNASTTRKIYETVGSKKATVAINSGEKNITLTCKPIEIRETGNGMLSAAFFASLFSWISGPVYLLFGLILAILIGIIIARRKKKQEEKEEEKDHV